LLSKITVQNVALIESLELDFCSTLNILSGETGAGKSILVDCLLLLLGGKYDKSILRFGCTSGFVEGFFEDDKKIAEVLDEYGFEKDESLIVSRKFFDTGKNEIRVNGKLSTTLMLQKMMGKLVDIYGQNEYQSLAQKTEHLRILNYFLRTELADKSKKMRESYMDIMSINRELRKVGDAKERAQNIDILQFQLKEIRKANVYGGEEDELLERRKLISSGEKIASSLNQAIANLSEGESSSQEGIDSAISAVKGISALMTRFNALYERLNSVSIELSDIIDTMHSELDDLEFDPKEFEKIEQRLDVIRTLKRKYGGFSEMKAFEKKSAELLDTMENGAFLFEKLQKDKTKKLTECIALATEISAIRKKGAKKLQELIKTELADLGMAGADFVVEFGENPSKDDFEKHLTSDGFDRPEFYFSANKGQPVKPLVKIISGGELSRFMLALKTVSSKSDDIPTMIFDEIDTGISGKIGQEVAKKLSIIASNHQVLCVTHLPQIAAMADNHYFIEKKVKNDQTITTVRKLDLLSEIEEISRLSGAKDISAQATENAKQMKNWSNEFKKTLT